MYILKIFYKISLIILFLFLSQQLSFASIDELCETSTGFTLYECRIEMCSDYKTDKPSYTPEEDYEEAESSSAFDDAKTLYRTNMNNIYKCNLIQTQKNTLTLMSEVIKAEQTWELDDSIWWKIETRKTNLDTTSESIPCVLTEKEEIYNKDNLLKETTYQACKYINYLEYLKEYYTDIWNLLSDETEEKYTNRYVANKMTNKLYEIEDEIDHTYKVFPLAYSAYSDYENNFPIHFLLDIIKDDYKIFRKKLYEVLMPIAQVWYKIINAMSY